MEIWTGDELTRIGDAEELEIASLRADGSLRKFVTIWVVRLGEELYVRSVNGRTSAWFRGIQTRHAGRIQAGGLTREVSFTEVPDAALNDQIDAIYRAKYRRYAASIIARINSPDARAAALRLDKRAAD